MLPNFCSPYQNYQVHPIRWTRCVPTDVTNPVDLTEIQDNWAVRGERDGPYLRWTGMTVALLLTCPLKTILGIHHQTGTTIPLDHRGTDQTETMEKQGMEATTANQHRTGKVWMAALVTALMDRKMNLKGKERMALRVEMAWMGRTTLGRTWIWSGERGIKEFYVLEKLAAVVYVRTVFLEQPKVQKTETMVLVNEREVLATNGVIKNVFTDQTAEPYPGKKDNDLSYQAAVVMAELYQMMLGMTSDDNARTHGEALAK